LCREFAKIKSVAASDTTSDTLVPWWCEQKSVPAGKVQVCLVYQTSLSDGNSIHVFLLISFRTYYLWLPMWLLCKRRTEM